MVVLPAEVEVDFVGEVVRMLEVVVAVKNLVSQYPPFPWWCLSIPEATRFWEGFTVGLALINDIPRIVATAAAIGP